MFHKMILRQRVLPGWWRHFIAAAPSINMTRDTVGSCAIKRGAGGDDGVELETLVYEGCSPAGTGDG